VKKLDAFNGDYIRAMPLDAFIERAAQEIPDAWDRDRFAAIAPYIQERLVRFDEVPGKVDFLFWPFDAPIVYDPDSWAKAFGADWAVPLLHDVTAAYGGLDVESGWTADALKAATEAVMEIHGVKLGKAQAVPRVAVTGRSVGPPLFESLEVLGRDETMRRLQLATDHADVPSSGGPE
jgi:glutamyl-tRNA synthetase